LLEPFTEAQHQRQPFWNRLMDASPDVRYLDCT
jgi:hypothetical protein